MKSSGPPGRGQSTHGDRILTEAANPASAGIDALDARGILEIIHREDLKAWRAIDGALDTIAEVVERVVEALREEGRLFYVGAGTSGRLGVLDAAECPPTFGVSPDRVIAILAGGPRALRRSVEGAEDFPENGARALRRYRVGSRDVVCGIAASGTTPFVIGALAEGKRRGAATVLIAGNPLKHRKRDSLPVDYVIELPVGPEVIAGSTRLKAGTTTKMVLNMITTAAMIRWGKVYDNLMVGLQPVNQKLRRRAVGLVEEIGEVSRERAKELLEVSGGNVKAAVVMARKGVSPEEGERLLEEADGLLRRVIAGNPESQIPNPKQIPNPQSQTERKFGLRK